MTFVQSHERSRMKLYGLLVLVVFLNIAYWLFSHREYPKWTNVPQAPTEDRMLMSFLGDRAFAYRAWALGLQNFGNIGFEVQPLKNYNYAELNRWFFLLDKMDPRSDSVPMLAAYYFSATQKPKEQVPYLISYLEEIGVRREGQKWRWLVQAVFLARHKLEDQQEALRISYKLKEMYRPGMPAWVLNMPAFISLEMGDKEAAYDLFVEILKSSANELHPNEVNWMVENICTKILTPDKAKINPLCQKS
jgi:hypothetical protein